MMSMGALDDSGLARYVPRQSAEWDLHGAGDWRELEATLCYVDISGFTALSEKLARRGRIGAEELTGVLNFVFGEMLGIAYDRGGSLLKFGGDALLLAFTGADHPQQACSAAVEMQGALRAASSYRTSAGRLHLRMSVGLHTGVVHLFRVGESHQELILTGPAATATTEMEETATAGEILVSSATKAALPGGSADRAKGHGWVLQWRRPRLDGVGWTPRLPLPPGAVVDAMPLGLRDYLRHGVAEPEHHTATVGFIRYTGVDAVMASGGPGAVAQGLAELVANVQRAVDDEEVTFLASDIDTDGGKIIIVAGVPGVREDDEGRVLRAARRIVDDAGVLPVKIGVNQGHVFVGEIGTEFRATYTIMGDTVNLAARLMAAASPGEIYAGASALGHALTLFETRALEPFHVKGKTHPVQAWAVGAASGTRPTGRGEDLPFVGREKELGRLRELIEGLGPDGRRRGRGGVVTVIGERGVGKSRLLDELRPLPAEVLRIEIRAEPYGTGTPYRPLRDPVRRLFGVDRAEPAVMADQLRDEVARLSRPALAWLPLIADVAMIPVPSTPEVDVLDPQFRSRRTADVLAGLLAHVFDGPVLFEIEDAHYMDEASAQVLGRVADATIDHPWLVLTTRRDTDTGFDPEREEIRLGPLDDHESRQLVRHATEATPLRPHDIDAIVERAGGLPLFLEEIVRAVRQAGGVDSLPDSLEAVVSAQIDALPPLTRRLLMFGSVLGRSFRVEILNDLVVEEGVRLDAATRRDLAGFLEPDGTGRVRFRHALIRDVAYAGLSFQRRRELHLRAGEAAEYGAGDHADAVADVLALHFSLGHDHDRAWRYCRIAGDQAAAAYANIDAAAHYERALDSARRLPHVADTDKAQVWTTLGDVRDRAGLFEEALEAYRRASRLVADDHRQRVALLLRRAVVRRRSGAYGPALRETAEGLALVARDPDDDAARARARLAAERSAIRRWQQRPTEALRHAEEAEADARRVGDLETLGRALDLIHWAHRMTGRTDRPAPYAETLRIYEEIGDLSGVAQVWNNLGAEAFYGGRWHEAIEAYGKSREAELRTGNDVQAAISAANIAELLINQGRLDEAEPMLTDALRVLQASHHAPAAAFAQSELARLLTRRGSYHEAQELLEEIRSRAAAAGESMNLLNAGILLADLELRRGEVDHALTMVRTAEAQAGELAELFGPTIGRLRASALGLLGDYEAAFAEIDSACSQASEQGLLYDQALLLAVKNEIAVRAGREPEPVDVHEADRLFVEMAIIPEPVLLR